MFSQHAEILQIYRGCSIALKRCSCLLICNNTESSAGPLLCLKCQRLPRRTARHAGIADLIWRQVLADEAGFGCCSCSGTSHILMWLQLKKSQKPPTRPSSLRSAAACLYEPLLLHDFKTIERRAFAAADCCSVGRSDSYSS